MKRIVVGVVVGLALYLAPDYASAQMALWSESSGVGGHRTYSATLVVDARPLDAEVLLDGRSIGLARDLMALAMTIRPGRHLLEIRAPGYLTYSSIFAGDRQDSVNRFSIRLPAAP